MLAHADLVRAALCFSATYHEVPLDLSAAMSNDEGIKRVYGLHPITDVILHRTVILTFAIQTQVKEFPSEGCIHAVCIQPKMPLQSERLFKGAKLNLFTFAFLLLIILKV